MAAEKKDEYIQIGYTALRDPATGDYLPAVPLYIKASDGAAEAEQKVIEDIGNLFAIPSWITSIAMPAARLLPIPGGT